EAFVARYKETFYADLARARIEHLRKQVASAPAPAPAPATPPQPQMAPPLNPSGTLNCPAGAGALGVARKVEVDTTGGPGFGSEQYGQHDFLRSKEVVLTFDDGPWPSTTPAVLHALARHCTKAIFFPIGKHALWHPEILREVAARGHTIGGHT